MTTAPTALADQPETMTGILQDSTGGDSRRQGSPKTVSLLEVIGIRRSLGTKTVEYPLVAVAV
ncbi:hypothetical protein RAB80_010213 [Fusarium oxysporum f. sp. vasinfectum]|nr:hypothetical protein RAB80_010213 [Fusarium oxysporum f. sp. vasinfectum]